MEPIQRHPATSGGLNGVEASVFSLTQIVVNRMTNEFSFSFAFYSLFVPLRDERKIDFLIAADRWNGNSRSKLHILANNGVEWRPMFSPNISKAHRVYPSNWTVCWMVVKLDGNNLRFAIQSHSIWFRILFSLFAISFSRHQCLVVECAFSSDPTDFRVHT